MSRAATTLVGRRGWRLVEADSLKFLSTLPPRSVDAVITDPPYGIGLRGAAWDVPGLKASATADTSAGGSYRAEMFERWSTAWAAECLRVLKPGGHLVSFGAPRTAHRLAAGIEDAGFELRDQLLWLYGSGVPKSRLAGGRSSTLKPAYEPIVLARAPLAGTHVENERTWGTGRLGIDEARIGGAAGRWPCNVVLSHTPRCQPARCAGRCAVSLIDRSWPSVRPARFFYCAKPSLAERDAGCDQLPARTMGIYGRAATKPRRNTHPTVKPLELMGWLIRLACPPEGLVLDPFAGSGSTGVAALRKQRRFLGIEREPVYTRIARARLAHAAQQPSAEAAGASRA